MHIGILQCGPVPPEIAQVHGQYTDIFARFLAGRDLSFEGWQVHEGDFPDSVTRCDGWLLTGSRHGVYETHDFLPPLERFVKDARAAGRPIVGLCFGHQLLAQAFGGRVEKSGKGWAVGRHVHHLADGTALALSAWHQDQVVEVPPGAEVLGGSDFCPVGILRYGDDALSLQLHPEFDQAITEALIDVRGSAPGYPQDRIAAARAALPEPLDRARAAKMIADFFHDAQAARAAASTHTAPPGDFVPRRGHSGDPA